MTVRVWHDHVGAEPVRGATVYVTVEGAVPLRSNSLAGVTDANGALTTKADGAVIVDVVPSGAMTSEQIHVRNAGVVDVVVYNSTLRFHVSLQPAIVPTSGPYWVSVPLPFGNASAYAERLVGGSLLLNRGGLENGFMPGFAYSQESPVVIGDAASYELKPNDVDILKSHGFGRLMGTGYSASGSPGAVAGSMTLDVTMGFIGTSPLPG